ncbi:MAG: hypothetical protein MI865_02925 [Proteobacteria bacterium]|nr:hypothetical protein [Pseudomonadota bacterium]
MKRLFALSLTLYFSIMNLYAAEEQDIALQDVPENVIEAANFMVKGIKIEEAELEKEGSYSEYELEGIANGQKYEMEVVLDKNNNIVKIELESEYEDDEHEDHDDDKDDDKISSNSDGLKKLLDFVKNNNKG